jgi:uncharacterized RDD family membrane protein YckC
MKCPKCGYLGFETTDRCRNCQYDFSLAPFSSEPDLTLHGNDRKIESSTDFELPPIKRQTDRLSATALDLDRLFGDPEPVSTPADAPEPPSLTVIEEAAPVAAVEESAPEPEADFQSMSFAAPEPEIVERVIAPVPEVEIAPLEMVSEPEADEPDEADVEMAPVSDESALPFDDAPLVPPPAARPPLAVRRSSPEVPRNRPRTTRPVRMDVLNLEDGQSTNKSSTAAREASETVASLLEAPSLGVRVGAGLIDLVLLIGIDAAVLFLTLRITGLQNTLEDLRVLPAVPLIGFLAILGFGYVAAFTVAGGQTIGKMVLSLRVIGDDGRPVDAAGGMIRALGCMLVPVTLGLSYLPALFTSDHRALHDRLAGTRVVQE